jgi:type IV pilus assembly protein PilO
MKIQLPDISSKVIQPIYDNVGKLGKGQRSGICAGAFFVLIGAFVYFSFFPKFTEIDQLKKDIEDLERKLMLSRKKALQLNKYQKMMAEAEAEFKIAKKALPEKKEIPSLLTGITDSGKDAGLEFLLFKPNPEEEKGFYAEIPVSIKVTGNFHNIAGFFDKVARLFRIVNITDIRLNLIKDTNNLNGSCMAVTYRFVEKEKKKEKKES